MAEMIMAGTVGLQGAHRTGAVVIILLVDHLMGADPEGTGLGPYLILHTGALREAATVGEEMFMLGKLDDDLCRRS